MDKTIVECKAKRWRHRDKSQLPPPSLQFPHVPILNNNTNAIIYAMDGLPYLTEAFHQFCINVSYASIEIRNA